MQRFLIGYGCAVSLGLGALLMMGVAKKPAGIPAWEYRVLDSDEFLQVDGKSGPTSNKFLAERLTKLGDDGWEFTGVVAIDSWVFKRPVIGD